MESGRGLMDIRDSLAIIPDPRIERCKKRPLFILISLVLSAANHRFEVPL
jgi:hypothetical protein